MERDPKELTFAEFFAGIGLVHAGLQDENWKCVYANDIDEKKFHMYSARFPEPSYYHVGDIWKTDDVVSRISGRPLLATASFPCVDLSVAGNRKGLTGNESSTLFAFMRVLRHLSSKGQQPPIVLLENVAGFITSSNGTDFHRALAELSQLGYSSDAFLLDAKYFVPQSRQRVFVISMLPEAIPRLAVPAKDGSKPSMEYTDILQSRGDMCPPKLKHSLLKCWDLRLLAIPFRHPSQATYDLQNFLLSDDELEWWSDDKVEAHLHRLPSVHLRAVLSVKGNADYKLFPAFKRKRQTGSRLEARFDGLAGCLRTPRGGSSRQVVIRAGRGRIDMRWMNACEYARLQGAPDFPITVSEHDALFGFGDAVCVPAIQWITKHLLSPIAQACCEKLATRRNTMSAVVSSGTMPEKDLRSILWSMGYKYRKQTDLPGKPDIVFPDAKLVVFIDGCQWHGCRKHCRIPRSNGEYWRAKIKRNRARDVTVEKELETKGWTVLRVWEHEVRDSLDSVVDRVELMLQSLGAVSGTVKK